MSHPPSIADAAGAPDRNVPALALAILEASTGQPDAALAHLEQSLDEQNWLAILWQTPVFAALRPDPRFQEILLNAGLVAEGGITATPADAVATVPVPASADPPATAPAFRVPDPPDSPSNITPPLL